MVLDPHDCKPLLLKVLRISLFLSSILLSLSQLGVVMRHLDLSSKRPRLLFEPQDLNV